MRTMSPSWNNGCAAAVRGTARRRSRGSGAKGSTRLRPELRSKNCCTIFAKTAPYLRSPPQPEPSHALGRCPRRQMSVTTPEDLARSIASDGVACTDTDVANRLLTHLRHAQAMGSPDSPEPIEVFARAGGVAALAAAMKANTPVAADWPEGTRPASGIDLAMVQKEGCGVLNNIAASALAGEMR